KELDGVNVVVELDCGSDRLVREVLGATVLLSLWFVIQSVGLARPLAAASDVGCTPLSGSPWTRNNWLFNPTISLPPVAPCRQNASPALPHQRPYRHSYLQFNFRVHRSLILRPLVKTEAWAPECANYPNVLAQPASEANYAKAST
ncbi:hypothetical protein IRJ41_022948, partial [Triplophysa rosa]